MAQRLDNITPSNQYYKPEHRSRFVITRKKAKDLVEILTKDYPTESSLLIPRINYELGHASHDTHLAFYIDDDSVDEITALQLASMELVFTHIEYGADTE